MKLLRTILKSNLFLIIFVMLVAIYIFYSVKIVNYSSIYNIDDNEFVGVISNYTIDGNYLAININSKENLRGSYYFKTLEEKENFVSNYNYGDLIKIKGILSIPSNNTVPNLFNYKEYLYRQKEYYVVNVETIELVKNNKNLIYSIRNFISNRIDNLKSKGYVNTFILGISRDIDRGAYVNYQELGVSHLLSVSGIHINLLTGLILFLFKKYKIVKYLLIFLFLLFYLFITNFTAPVLRALVFFSFVVINKVFKLEISSLKLLIFSASSILLVAPFFVYNIGFLFTFIVTAFLIIFGDKISEEDNYFIKLVKTSYIAFLASLPIVIYNFYEISLLTIINNLIFVPLITFVLSPICMIVLIFPMLDDFLYMFISLTEELSNLFTSFNITCVFIKPSIIVSFIYYILVYIVLKNIKFLMLLLLILLFHSNYNKIIKKDYLIMIDVKQGDSILIHSNGKSMLIDTGGKVEFVKEEWQIRKNSRGYAEGTLIPLFKSLGIRKLDYLVFTHGDNDHLGEGINLIKNYDISEVYFNNNEYNNREKEIIKVLEELDIPYYKMNNRYRFNLQNYSFISLNDAYDNENDSSIVLLANINDYKLLLTGDISEKVEKDLVNKYNLGNIDILKVAHHGSKYSTSIELLEEIKPNISLISVSLNNIYKHPSDRVIKDLEKYSVKNYLTSVDGSVIINFSKSVTLETFPP